MFASILVKNFALQAALRWRDEPSTVAVIDSEQTRALVLDASLDARKQGVKEGLTAAQALARCAGLRILSRSASQEEAVSALLVETAFGFSPNVESTAPDTATIDLSTAPKGACWQRLGEEMVRRLKAESIDAVVGMASNADHALLAAQCASPVNVVYDGATFCAALPIVALEPNARMLSILHDWGIKTIGDLLKLPKPEVVLRLGIDAEKMWKRASGRSRRALRLARQMETFIEAFEFEYAVDITEPLLFLIRRFLDSLCSRIRDQHRVVGKMRLSLPLDDKSNHSREFSVPAPTTSVDALYRIIDTHIETLRLEQQPIGIRLELCAALPLGRQLALFEQGLKDPNGFGETLARLQAVVGGESVGMPMHADTHRPDICRMAEFEEVAVPAASSAIQFGLPLRRLRPPVSIEVRLSDFEPAWIHAGQWNGPVRQISGPYRFSGEWWAESPWAIEEWDVEVEGQGLIRLGRRAEGWTLEGIYNALH